MVAARLGVDWDSLDFSDVRAVGGAHRGSRVMGTVGAD